MDEFHHDRYREGVLGATKLNLVVRFFVSGNVASSMSAETDGQGRLYIPKEVREKYGQKYHIVTYEDRIELIPVADDPLTAVREAGGELHDASVEEIRDDIEEAAKDEAEQAGGDR
jgi:bifunctional DNA-binding transcriptional regulator/antitoxin component of YhaV-PrlF toxin-antitoxin module